MDQKKTKQIYLLVALLLILSLFSFLSIFYLKSKITLEKKEIITTLIIGNRTGFDLNSSALVFGMISEGSSANRKINVSNSYGFPIKAEFSFSGNIKNFVNPVPVVYLMPGETKEIGITTIEIPKDTKFGNYSGIMEVVFKRDI
jgi:hypothetical protein